MGNIPYYLSLPHPRTWYVYIRNSNHIYEEAPLHIWHDITLHEALSNFHELLPYFQESSNNVMYLYRGLKRYARVSKNADELEVRSDVLEEWIHMFNNTYTRKDVQSILVRMNG